MPFQNPSSDQISPLSTTPSAIWPLNPFNGQSLVNSPGSQQQAWPSMPNTTASLNNSATWGSLPNPAVSTSTQPVSPLLTPTTHRGFRSHPQVEIGGFNPPLAHTSSLAPQQIAAPALHQQARSLPNNSQVRSGPIIEITPQSSSIDSESPSASLTAVQRQNSDIDFFAALGDDVQQFLNNTTTTAGNNVNGGINNPFGFSAERNNNNGLHVATLSLYPPSSSTGSAGNIQNLDATWNELATTLPCDDTISNLSSSPLFETDLSNPFFTDNSYPFLTDTFPLKVGDMVGLQQQQQQVGPIDPSSMADASGFARADLGEASGYSSVSMDMDLHWSIPLQPSLATTHGSTNSHGGTPAAATITKSDSPTADFLFSTLN